MVSTMKKIGVIGAGQMGHGIAQVAAMSGYAVRLHDQSEEAAEKGLAAITRSLDKLVSKERITEDLRNESLARIEIGADLGTFRDVDLAIEAIVENIQIKRALFGQLDQILPEEAILATNTSSISITALGAATSRPDKVIGMHFMNPVPIMKLVEVINGLATSEKTTAAVREVSEKMGKTVVFSSDSPGFIVNRILMPMINEAVYTLHEGVGTVEDIDQAMKLGTNQPMGPLTLADFIGLDTCLAIMEVLHTNLGDSKYRPCPLLRNYVTAGWLGRKSGRGFYQY